MWLRDWSYAHRGLHSDGVPENSLAAFAGAMERGMGIECDIQRSQDHAAILMHDWELDRLTGVSGPTAGYSAEELAQLAFLDTLFQVRVTQAAEHADFFVDLVVEEMLVQLEG